MKKIINRNYKKYYTLLLSLATLLMPKLSKLRYMVVVLIWWGGVVAPKQRSVKPAGEADKAAVLRSSKGIRSKSAILKFGLDWFGLNFVKPLYIDTITKNIIIWQPKNIIKFCNVNTSLQLYSYSSPSLLLYSYSSPSKSGALPKKGQKDYSVNLLALIYWITILIILCFYIFLLTIIPIEEWPITILNLKMSLSILVSNLITSSFLIFENLFSFNVIHADSTDDEAEDFSGSGQNTPKGDTTGDVTPKASTNVKLNLEEVNMKLRTTTGEDKIEAMDELFILKPELKTHWERLRELGYSRKKAYISCEKVYKVELRKQVEAEQQAASSQQVDSTAASTSMQQNAD